MENLNSVDFKDLKVPFKGQIIIVSKVFDDGSEVVIFATEREELAQFFCETSNLVRESTNYHFQFRLIDCIY